MNRADLERQSQKFFTHLEHQLSINAICLEPHWDIDHICYRVETRLRYEELKDAIGQFADLLTESEVGGRPIATYRLHQALLFQGQSIEVLELPAPKPSKPITEGFEHVEIVVDISFAQLRARWPELNFKEPARQKKLNPELALELEGCAIKFHHLALAEVVRLESQTQFGHECPPEGR